VHWFAPTDRRNEARRDWTSPAQQNFDCPEVILLSLKAQFGIGGVGKGKGYSRNTGERPISGI
jgi:hypothetical protein